MSDGNRATFGMLASLTQVHATTPTIWLVAAGLVAVLFANTYLMLLNNPSFRWQYGLFRFIAYSAMAILAYATGGFAAVLPTLTSFLGMELQRLMTYLDIQLHIVKEKAAKLASIFRRRV